MGEGSICKVKDSRFTSYGHSYRGVIFTSAAGSGESGKTDSSCDVLSASITLLP